MLKQNNSGQALLIILLIMAVALTIGLSVISRSITDIRISQEQEESARAFSAAEAGLETFLATGDKITEFEGFTVTTEEESLGGSNSFIFPEEVGAGSTKTIWLVSHEGEALQDDFKPFTDFTFYWGNPSLSASDPPALEATIVYKSGGEYMTTKAVFDPNPSRAAENGFTNSTIDTGGSSLGETNFAFRVDFSDDEDSDFPLVGGDYYALRIKFLYNNNAQVLGVGSSGDDLPLQGTRYRVEASNPETGISRKVEQCQLYKAPPLMFDYVLFSGSSL